MPVKCIRYIELKRQDVGFVQREFLDDREILIVIPLTSDTALDKTQIAKYKPSLGHRARSIGIYERSAIEEAVCSCRCEQSCHRVFLATAAAQTRVVGRVAWA